MQAMHTSESKFCLWLSSWPGFFHEDKRVLNVLMEETVANYGG